MDPSEEVEKELSNSIAQNSARTLSKNHQKKCMRQIIPAVSAFAEIYPFYIEKVVFL